MSLLNFFTSFSLTNNVDGQHILSGVPNGPVTNGVMTYAVPSEGNSVIDHGFNERLSPHVTPDGVSSHLSPDTNGSTFLNTRENGHSLQELWNGGSSSVTPEETNRPEQQLSEEKSETLTNKDEGQVEREEAPEKESQDDSPVSTATEFPAEKKNPQVKKRNKYQHLNKVSVPV